MRCDESCHQPSVTMQPTRDQRHHTLDSTSSDSRTWPGRQRPDPPTDTDYCRCCSASCIIPPGLDAGSPPWWRASLLLVQPAVRVQSSTSNRVQPANVILHCIRLDSSLTRRLRTPAGPVGVSSHVQSLCAVYVCERECVCQWHDAPEAATRCPTKIETSLARHPVLPIFPVVDSSCSPSQMHLSQQPLRNAALSSSSSIQSSLACLCTSPPSHFSLILSKI